MVDKVRIASRGRSCKVLAQGTGTLGKCHARRADFGHATHLSSGKGREALFGDTAFFRKGLNDLIGLPDEDIAEAMEAEHISAETSYETFQTSNYNTSTCPAKVARLIFVLDVAAKI